MSSPEPDLQPAGAAGQDGPAAEQAVAGLDGPDGAGLAGAGLAGPGLVGEWVRPAVLWVYAHGGHDPVAGPFVYEQDAVREALRRRVRAFTVWDVQAGQPVSTHR